MDGVEKMNEYEAWTACIGMICAAVAFCTLIINVSKLR